MPDDAPAAPRRIYLFKEGGKPKAFLNDAGVNGNTVANITVPGKAEADIEAFNANVIY